MRQQPSSSSSTILSTMVGQNSCWILVVVAVIHQAHGNFHTEGGNFKLPTKQQAYNNPSSSQYTNQYENQQAQTQQQQKSAELAGIVEQLNEQLRASQAYDEPVEEDGQTTAQEDRFAALEELAAQQRAREAEQNYLNYRQKQQRDEEREELQRFGYKFPELSEQIARDDASEVQGTTSTAQEDEEVPVEQPKSKTEKPLSAQKKGQSEYVEFIEPVHSNKLMNKEFMEKRVAVEDHLARHPHYRAFNLISNSGNIAFVALITMCCVFSVVGVVGGMYYYNHIKATREDPFDDFTRYSPAGPGRDKLRKDTGKGGAAFGGEKGDDTLAYKAQLHHYQQTKQKIIGEQANVDASDKSDDEADLEHNFSVYECPGLAYPNTGNIEVQNPNFVESPNSGGRAPTITSPH